MEAKQTGNLITDAEPGKDVGGVHHRFCRRHWSKTIISTFHFWFNV